LLRRGASDTVDASMSGGLPQRDVASDSGWSAGLALGHLTLLRRVGAGGMAEVFEARHEVLGTRVAVKRLRFDARARPEHSARFLREGRAAGSIRHPHVVQVFDVGTHEGVPYLVMEFLEGDDLERHLTARGPLPVGEAADLLLPLLSALRAAHAAGVIHRDLKPANVVLARDHGGRARPVLVDFGIARVALASDDAPLTHDDALLGTPAYLAPEQCLGATRATAASDQYALALIFYRCLTGRLPFIEPTLPLLLAAIGSNDVPSARSLRAEVPEALDAAVLRALSRDPASRHENLTAFAAALLPFASERGRALWASLEASDEPVPLLTPPPAATEGHEALATPAGVVTTVPPAARPRRLVVAALGLLAALLGALAAARQLAPRETASTTQRVAPPVPAPAASPQPAAAPLSPTPAPRAVPAPAARRVRPSPAATRRPPQRAARDRAAPQAVDAGSPPRTCIGPNGVNLCL
jgi:tRNA A-37 threonylcarbamoyl transferase component Bud32